MLICKLVQFIVQSSVTIKRHTVSLSGSVFSARKIRLAGFGNDTLVDGWNISDCVDQCSDAH